MVKGIRSIFLITIIVITFFCPVLLPTTQAQENKISEELAIVLLIDISGSMSRTDPERLRETAAGVFIDLLSPDDYLGILTFDHEVEMVVPLEQVKDFENKNRIKETLYQKLDPRGYTDYVGALEAVYDHLQEADIINAQPIVIFLTDGDPNPYANSRDDPEFMAGYLESLWNLVRKFASARYPIYSVGFSDEIEPDVLERISLETRAGSYILNSSDELLVTFFSLLGGLKNRQILIEEALPGGAEKSYTFQVDEYTRQLNFVIASEDRGTRLALKTPDGREVEPDQIPGVFITEEKGSTLIVLHQVEESYRGEWVLSVSGDLPTQVLGDKDLYLQVSIMEPLPYSQQPVNEPLIFQVKLNREGAIQEASLRTEIQLTGPGIERPLYIALNEDSDGVFSGFFDQMTRPGTYEFQVRVFLGDELLSSTSSVIHGLLIPSTATDFYVDETYLAGDEFIVTASLLVGGNRLLDGRDLRVEEFKLLINYDDGTRETFSFYDSGNYEEHGDFRRGDGIWSNRVQLEEPGSAEAYLIAEGEYRGTDFTLEKRLGDISIFSPGSVLISSQESLWSVPGRNATLSLRVNNQSGLRETLFLRIEGEVGSIGQQKIDLAPGEERAIHLEIGFDSNLTPGKYQMPLVFQVERESTALEPDSLVVPVELVTSREAFMRNYLSTISMILIAAVLIIIIYTFVVIIGLVLYKIIISPQLRIKGSLFYQRTDATKDEGWKEIKFKGLKDKAVITFDENNEQANFYVPGSEFNYDIEIQAKWPKQGSRFMQGFRSLRNRYMPVQNILRCTPPGVIEYAGKIYTDKELLHEDRFESAEFSFHYVNMYAKWYKEKEEGIDLLEGKSFAGNYEDDPGL